MNKTHFLSIIEKYSLNGLIEQATFIIKDKNVNISAVSPTKDVVCFVSGPDFHFPDVEIWVYNTSQLLKLVSITGQNISPSIKMKGKIPEKLLIADSDFNLEYVLADKFIMPRVPKINEPKYEYSLEIDENLINKFVKAKKAVSADDLIMEPVENVIWQNKFLLGGLEEYSNKVDIIAPLSLKEETPNYKLIFNSNIVKEIFLANKDLTSNGKCFFSKEGLMKIEFTCENEVKSTYLLVAKD